MLCDPPIPGGRLRESPAILWPLPAPSQRDTGGFRVEGRAGGSPSSSPRPPPMPSAGAHQLTKGGRVRVQTSQGSASFQSSGHTTASRQTMALAHDWPMSRAMTST